MGRIAAIGSEPRVQGFALAGALVTVADTPEDVRRAWADLPPDVQLVILTPQAAQALARQLDDVSSPRLSAVMPP
jgi:vacuolar-type H+-ATPase subunit F/Vma7